MQSNVALFSSCGNSFHIDVCPWLVMTMKFVTCVLQDGRINYDEFAAMMRKGNPEALTKKRRDSFVSH